MAIYEIVNQRIEEFSKIVYFGMIKMSPIGFVVPKFLGYMFIYFTTDLGKEALKLPLPMWFPFDSKNLIGYLIAVALEYLSDLHICFFVASIFSLAVGGFIFTFSMTEDIKNNLNSINQNIETDGTRSEFYKKFSRFVQLHSNAQQLSGSIWLNLWKKLRKKTNLLFSDWFKNSQKHFSIYFYFCLSGALSRSADQC